MRNKKINRHLNKALHEAPIDLLDKIKSQPIEKMERHDYITARESMPASKRHWKPILAFSTVVAVFICVFFGWFAQHSVVDSIVYFDVNPSIEISTNEDERVVNLQVLNQEDKALVENINYKGKDLYTVTRELLNVLLREGYIDTLHHTMLVSVINDNSEKSKTQTSRLNNVIHDYLEEQNIRPIVLRQSITTSDNSVEFGGNNSVSTGKITFIRNLVILNPEFKVEHLVNLPIEDLVRLSVETGLDLKSIIEVDDDLNEFYRDDVPEKEQSNGDKKNQDTDTSSPNNLMSKEEAKSIALGLVNGSIVEFELDEDDGRYTYEIEVVRGGKEYNIEIDAHTGNVLKYEADDGD